MDDQTNRSYTIEEIISAQKLIEYIEELKRDATRYRWLREKCTTTTGEYDEGAQLYFGIYFSEVGDGYGLDAAVDFEMQSNKT